MIHRSYRAIVKTDARFSSELPYFPPQDLPGSWLGLGWFRSGHKYTYGQGVLFNHRLGLAFLAPYGGQSYYDTQAFCEFDEDELTKDQIQHASFNCTARGWSWLDRAKLDPWSGRRFFFQPGFSDNSDSGLVGSLCDHITTQTRGFGRQELAPVFVCDRFILDFFKLYHGGHEAWFDAPSMALGAHAERKTNALVLAAPTWPGVYVLRAGQFCKIGKSSNIRSRISALSTACPYDFDAVAAWKLDRPSEKEHIAHRRMSNKRHKGEWFSVGFDDCVNDISLTFGKYPNFKDCL